jgi:hypothetical protein
MDDALPVAGTELLGAVALTVFMVAAFRRGWPIAPMWLFVLISGGAGQLASFLMLAMQGHDLTWQHIAYHVVLGIIASGSDKVVNLAHVGAEVSKNGEGRL